MKYSNKKLSSIIDGLNETANQNIELPSVVAYTIAFNRNAISKALEPYYEVRNSIIKKYSNGSGTIDEKSNPEEYAKAISEITKISEEEIEIELRTIPFDKIKDLNLTLNFINSIYFMIEE